MLITEKREVEGNCVLKPREPRSSTDEPVFTSTHGALRFALNHAHGTLQKPLITRLMGGASGGRGLGGLDGAGQAGLILAELENLSELHGAFVLARYAAPTVPCECRSQCCRGYRESELWRVAIEYLVRYVLVEGLTGTFSHYRLRRAIVTRYFGIKASFVDIAKECGVCRNTASSYNAKVVERFRGTKEKKGVEALAFEAIDTRLRERGVVGRA